MVEVDEADVVTEVSECFVAYDEALLANDLEALDRWFWASPSAVRYGIGEELHGYDAIAAHRRSNPGPITRGPITRRAITTFGRDAATVCVEFDGNGRQTQTWIRVGDEWRIVCAHVSLRHGP
jgi:hypothetical protein